MQFREVYDAHFAFVWRSLRRLGMPETAVQDAAQDVFLVVYRKLAEFEERSKLTTWLFRICLRVAKDYRRRAHVRREVFDDAGIASSTDHYADTARGAERSEHLALFDRALGGVDLDQRAVFILFEIEGMTGDAIAETLGIPLGTVYSRLRLAREAFKRSVLRQSALRAPRPRGSVA